MSKRMIAPLFTALALLLVGCGGPSCEERGGELVQRFSHFQPVRVGNITIQQPVYIYTCEMPR